MNEDLECILYAQDQLKQRVKQLADNVNADYVGKFPIVVGILKGSIIFYADFIRNLTIPIELDFMAISSYGSGTVSSGKLVIKKDLDGYITDRDIIIVEDILDSGFTLANLKLLLSERGAASIKIVTLLNKVERNKYEVKSDYNGFEIEDKFVVGYGLDYDEKYRNLPYIGILKPSVYEKRGQ